MIVDWFIGLWTSFLNSVAGILPTSDPFKDTGSWGLWTTMDYFLPVHELLGVFAVVFALGGPMLVASFLIWLIFGVVRGAPTKL